MGVSSLHPMRSFSIFATTDISLSLHTHVAVPLLTNKCLISFLWTREAFARSSEGLEGKEGVI